MPNNPKNVPEGIPEILAQVGGNQPYEAFLRSWPGRCVARSLGYSYDHSLELTHSLTVCHRSQPEDSQLVLPGVSQSVSPGVSRPSVGVSPLRG